MLNLNEVITIANIDVVNVITDERSSQHGHCRQSMLIMGQLNCIHNMDRKIVVRKNLNWRFFMNCQ